MPAVTARAMGVGWKGEEQGREDDSQQWPAGTMPVASHHPHGYSRAPGLGTDSILLESASESGARAGQGLRGADE